MTSRKRVSSRRRSAAHRIRRYLRIRTELAGAIRSILDSRAERCDDDCRGYFVDAERPELQRCDECASLNGYAAHIHDDDILIMPEARKHLRRELANDAKRSSSEGASDIVQ